MSATEAKRDTALRFEPLQSSVNTTFWQAFSALKINELKLSESTIDLVGHFTGGSPHPKASIPPRIYLNDSSIKNKDAKLPEFYFALPGTLQNFNKVEDFKACDKKKILLETSQQILKDIESGKCLENPSLLQRFYMISYADLKKHKFVYFLCFPAIVPDGFKICSYQEAALLQNYKLFNQTPESRSLLYASFKSFYSQNNRNQSCFVLNLPHGELNEFNFEPLSSLSKVAAAATDAAGSGNDVLKDKMIVYVDPGTLSHNPSWHLRNILLFLANKFKLDRVRVLCLRNLARNLNDSIVLSLELQNPSLPDSNDPASIRASGWERVDDKAKPRKIDLSKHLNPAILAEESSNLNLKLMKWRQFPSLQLEAIAATKCLLLGAGTLGCQVARSLIGWGVRDITFVDYGKVSYSNPVRQCLFTFEDCQNGGKYKAEAAKERLTQICPSVRAKSHVLSIPMPGHPVPASELKNIEKDFETLVTLIQECDVMFLLLDSREARWLPTMLGVAYNKIVLNSALGFDTYVVMRHGNLSDEELQSLKKAAQEEAKVVGVDAVETEGKEEAKEEVEPKLQPKKRLGCYYCQDVVAPRNSIADRTLDQQCTVTRPGLSGIAGSVIVELMVCIVQHPERQFAQVSDEVGGEKNVLNMRDMGRSFSVIPHQIRGSLHDYSCSNYNVCSFEQCPGCSLKIVSEYFKHGFQFVARVINEPKFLEDVSGLTKLQSALDECDFDLDLDDDDMDLTDADENENKNEQKREDGAETQQKSSGLQVDEDGVEYVDV